MRTEFLRWNKKAFFIILKGLSVVKNCPTPESPPLRVKLWRVGPCKRKMRAFCVPFILSEVDFFNICILSQYIVYWIHFHNILLKKRYYFMYFCCLFLKSSKAFSVSLVLTEADKIEEKEVKLSNKTLLHRKSLIAFADYVD